MDAQLRQRLIGAAVLIALAVIFLPMLLDGKRNVPGRQVSVEIPIQPPLEEREVVVPAQRPEAPTPDVPDPTLAAPDAGATEPVQEATVSVQAEPVPAPDTTKPDTPPATAPTVVTTEAKVPEAKPAQASTATTPNPPAQFDGAQSREGRFALSFGSYGNETNAKNLVAQLAMAGLDAVSEPVQSNGKNLFRVRALGFANRTQAEQARLHAKRSVAKVEPQIVELALPDAAAPNRIAASGVKQWVVQIGVFSDQSKATQLRDRLMAERFPAFVQAIQASNGPAWRVRVGPHARESDAKTTRQAVKDRLRLDGIVVSDP